MKHTNNKRAVTLVEVLIALSIFALAALPSIGTFSSQYTMATKQMEQEMALKIAEASVNLLQSVPYDSIIKEKLGEIPFDIQASNKSLKSRLVFNGLKGKSDKIQINRIAYEVEVEIEKAFPKQDINAPHGNALEFSYLELDGENKLVRDASNMPILSSASSFDDGYIINVTVNFGKTLPIKLTSFRVDMVK